MIDLSKIKTEKENSNSVNYSEMSIIDSVKLMNQEDINAVKCIESQYTEIAKLIEKTGETLIRDGKDNINKSFNCMTRMRSEIKDTSKVNEKELKK